MAYLMLKNTFRKHLCLKNLIQLETWKQHHDMKSAKLKLCQNEHNQAQISNRRSLTVAHGAYIKHISHFGKHGLVPKVLPNTCLEAITLKGFKSLHST